MSQSKRSRSICDFLIFGGGGGGGWDVGRGKENQFSVGALVKWYQLH